MLKHPFYEALAGQVSGFTLSCLAVNERKGDFPILMGNNIPLRNHPPVQVAGQVLQGGIPCPGETAINHPVGLLKIGLERNMEQFEPGQDLPPEQAVQDPFRDQKPVSGMNAETFLRMVGNPRDNEVNMGMIVQLPTMGVQHTGQSNQPTQEFWI